MLVIIIPSLSFEGTTRAYLLKILITRISVGSAPQILAIKDECNSCFSHFLIIGLGNSSANAFNFNRTTRSRFFVSKADFLSQKFINH